VWWDGRCPAHDDQRASLSFKNGHTSVVFECHAGCPSHAVLAALAALGLRGEDLRLSNGNGHGPEPSRIVAEYDYIDEQGARLYQAVRFLPKGFRQRRPDGRGGWIWNLDEVRLVLYRLHELGGHARLFVVEGEKDADRLWSLGLPATCNSMGAGKWRDEYVAQLRAAGVTEVVIIPDNDRPGVQHAEAVAQRCHAAGLVVRLVSLPGLPPVQPKHGEDVSDWLDAGHSADELRRVVEAAPRWMPTTASAGPSRSPALMQFTRLGDLLHEPEETTAWLVEGRLPTGGISLLAGKPKAGKSTAARCLSLAVARGEPWLGWATLKGPVFYLALEEKRAEVRRHYQAMGATDEDVRVFVAPSPEDGLRQLREAAEREKPVLIIVDPLLRFVRVRDANDYAVVTAALEPLVTLARETGAHVLAVHHLGKADRDGGDGIIGSTAFFAAVDTALLLRRSEQYRTLGSLQRYGEDLEEITLTLDPVTRWVTAGPSRREADEVKTADAILEYLGGQSDPVDEPAVLEAVEGRNKVKVRALRQLVADHRVERTGAGKRGNPYRYHLSPGAPTDSRTLVPSYIRERGNEKPENGSIPSIDASDSRSRICAGSLVPPDSRERESGPPSAGPARPLVVEL
jgi:hypothetical protein